MSTPVACEVALRCTSPEGPARVCAFYSTYTPPTPGYPGWCKYASTPAGFCGHPQARLLAIREAVREVMGFLPDLSPPFDAEAYWTKEQSRVLAEQVDREDQIKLREVIEERVKNDECPDCGLKLTFTDEGDFTGFDGDAQGLKRVGVTCQRCKTFTTCIYTKDDKRCPWGELTSTVKKGRAE